MSDLDKLIEKESGWLTAIERSHNEKIRELVEAGLKVGYKQALKDTTQPKNTYTLQLTIWNIASDWVNKRIGGKKDE